MINLLNFGEKNKGIKNIVVSTSATTIEKNISLDKKATQRQLKIYEDTKNYIETIVNNNTIVKNIPTLNEIELTNYSIQFDNTNKYIHVKDRINGFVYATFSLGNKKLESGDNVQFIIFNILQKISCPNASEGCKQFCYANKTNTNVNAKNSSSRNSRVNNLILTMFKNFDSIVNEVITFMSEYTNRKIYFRFHESGDIYCKEYWNKIKNVMINNKEINFMYYTKTAFILNEINDINKFDNVTLRYSLDSTTNRNIVEKCDNINCLTFIVIDKAAAIEAVQTVGNSHICNTKKINIQDTYDKIQILKEQLKAETRKSYITKINNEIYKLNLSLINKNQKCTNCMKCFNKNNIALFVATH